LTISFLRKSAMALAAGIAAYVPLAQAQDAPAVPDSAFSAPVKWEVMLSPYTLHYSKETDYSHVYLIGGEYYYSGNWMVGGAYFSNSFGQDSGVGYVGYRWDKLLGVERLYAKAMAGIMYGYVEPYEDKVPYNHNGWSPIISVALGFLVTPKDAVQVTALGSSGLMFSYNRRF